MSGRAWFEQFAASGPDHDGRRLSVAELQALLLKAGIGDGLPLGHAQDLSALAPLLMSDPHLLAMAAAALDGHHHRPHIEGTDEHAVVERAQVLMAAPMVLDSMVAGSKRVVLHDVDWPLLLWPYLAHAARVYEMAFTCANGGKGTVMISVSDRDELDGFGDPQSVPFAVLDRLNALAAKTYVPASAASRLAGAGAGLTDND